MTHPEGGDPLARIAGYLDRFGRDRDLHLPPLGADGVGHVQRGSAVVSIHVLADKHVLLVLSKIRDPIPPGELQATVRAVLSIRGAKALLDDQPVLQSAIGLRNPYVDPLSLIQVSLLKRKRERGEGDAEGEQVDATLATTLSGVAQGLRNTG